MACYPEWPLTRSRHSAPGTGDGNAGARYMSAAASSWNPSVPVGSVGVVQDVDVSHAGELRKPLLFCAVLLPWRLKSLLLRHALGWSLHPTSRIGLSLIDATNVRLGPGARIGHFNVIRGLTHLDMGEAAIIGNWNWFSAASMFLERDKATRIVSFRGLRLASESSITSRHYIDCSGGITIGHHTIVGGVRTTILTHQIDPAQSRQTTSGVSIGSYCFVSSNVTVVPGASIGDRVVVAMGATVVGSLEEGAALYGGVPARVVRRGMDDARYFRRAHGFVSLDPSPVVSPEGTGEDRNRHDP